MYNVAMIKVVILLMLLSIYIQGFEKSMTDNNMSENLTPLQYAVTQKDATEPPFENEYWDNKEKGLYVDIVSGEALFTSKEKYQSGCGWPSFKAPVDDASIIEKKDFKLSSSRIEVRSKQGNSHLGHVFPDGPGPSGLRYCINSASLRFIPVEKLDAAGYSEYKSLEY
jgi:methionine-R-sulfoxide reductase